MEILNSTRSECFRLVRAARFDPGSFDWTEHSETEFPGPWDPTFPRMFCVEHPTFHFTFYQGAISIAPGRRNFEEREQIESESDALATFANWLENIRREVATGDPWEDLKKGILPEEELDEAWNLDEPFSPEEARRIGEALDALREESSIGLIFRTRRSIPSRPTWTGSRMSCGAKPGVHGSICCLGSF